MELELQSQYQQLCKKHSIFDRVSDEFRYCIYVDDAEIYDNSSNIQLSTNVHCLGFIGDTIAEYHYNDSECKVGEYYRLTQWKKRKNLMLYIKRDDEALAHIMQVAENWKIESLRYHVLNKNSILLVGDLEELMTTKWKLQGLMQIYRLIWKKNTSEKSLKPILKYIVDHYGPKSPYVLIYELGNKVIELNDNLNFIDDKYYTNYSGTMAKGSQTYGICNLINDILHTVTENETKNQITPSLT